MSIKGSDFPNPAANLHIALSRKTLRKQRDTAIKEATQADAKGWVAFKRTVRADALSGMMATRTALSPVTVGVDALMGTNRTDTMKKETTTKNKLKHVCSAGVVGLGCNAVSAVTAVGACAAGAVVGGALGILATPIVAQPVPKGMVLGTAAAAAVVKYPLMAINFGLVQTASTLATVPKLLINGVGGAGGALMGVGHGTVRALRAPSKKVPEAAADA